MEKKVFGSRLSILLIGILLAGLLPSFISAYYSETILMGGILLFVVLLFCGMRYIIIGNNLYIKVCWIIPFGTVDIMDIISLERSYNLVSSPAASLKRLLIRSQKSRWSSLLISPVREQEFCDILKKINPDIHVRVNDKKARYRIWDWDIPISKRDGTNHE